MKFLFIDTSNSCINLYVIRNNDILVEKHISVLKDMANTIVPLIRDTFNELDFSIKDVDKIFVTVGPGSFTGIRVGVTVCKTIAWGLSIPIYPISTLEYLASTDNNSDRIISIIDARRDNVFAGYYDSNLQRLKEEELISFSDIDIKQGDILVSYDGVNDSIISKPDVIKIIKKHINDKEFNPHTLVPNYLKRTEAEENLDD